MDIHADLSTLAPAVKAAAAVAPSKSTNPALTQVHIRAQGAALTITATDLHRTLIQTVPVRVEAEGEMTADAAKLAAVLGSLDGPAVRLREASGSALTVSSGRSRFRVPGTDGSEYPHQPTPTASGDILTISITGQALVRLIADVADSVSADESRADLAGVHVEVEEADGGRLLRMVSTDGARLSLSQCEAQSITGDMTRGQLLPLDGLRTAARLIGRDDDLWTLTIGGRSAVLEGEGVSLVMRLIAGQFVPYRAVLPEADSMSRTLTVDRDSLADAVKRVGLMASDRNHVGKLAISADSIELSAETVDAGTAHEEVPCSLEGDAVELGMNLTFLGSALGLVRGSEVSLSLGEPLDPVIMRDPTRAGDWLCVLMPMRLD